MQRILWECDDFIFFDSATHESDRKASLERHVHRLTFLTPQGPVPTSELRKKATQGNSIGDWMREMASSLSTTTDRTTGRWESVWNLRFVMMHGLFLISVLEFHGEEETLTVRGHSIDKKITSGKHSIASQFDGW